MEVSSLSAKTETLDELTVTRDVYIGEVAEEAAALTNQEQQSTTRVVIVLVLFEVLSEIFDALAQEGNLDLGGSSVTGVSCVFVDDRLLDVCFESHMVIPFLCPLRGARNWVFELSVSAAVTRQLP